MIVIRMLLAVGFIALSSCATTTSRPDSAKTTLAYDVVGSGDVTLIFVHGWACDRTYWREQIAAFSDDYRVVALDLAGHGDSPAEGSDYSMSRFGADVRAVADELGAQKIVLVGHSMGGPVILEAAALMEPRVLAIIGVDTLKRANGSPMTRTAAEQAWTPLKNDFSARMISMVSTRLLTSDSPPDLAQEIPKDMAAANQDVALAAGIQMMMFDTASALARVAAIPVVLINSDHTPTDESGLQAAHPNARLVEISNSDHFVMLQQPAEFNRRMKSVLTDLMAE